MSNQSKLYVPNNPLETLKLCRGYYERPPGGPLVGYAGTYDGGVAGGPAIKKQFVGFKYFNCAKAEQYPFVRGRWAHDLKDKWKIGSWKIVDPDVILGAPMGGILFSGSLAEAHGCRGIFAEKRVKKSSETAGGRDETELILDRHEIDSGDLVVIGEDVCNNFSTTAELVKLILSCGAIPCAIACIINRSSSTEYHVGDGTILPVVSLAYIPTEQFKQWDPAVCGDIQRENIVWKPKTRANWVGLMKLMDQART